MIFNSIEFLIFFPIVLILYYFIPQKVRYIFLLAASYYFYMCWNAKYALLLLGVTAITYIGGNVLDWIETKKWRDESITRAKKVCLIVSITIVLSILLFYKYVDFVLLNLNRIMRIAHIELNLPLIDIVLPVGISFYTFQAIGYLVDVYRKDIYAEKNFFRYALFVSFFPQLVAGPIERSKNLLVQLYQSKRIEWNNIKEGFLLILYGLFLKVAIADRAAIIVNAVYARPKEYQGFLIIVATIFFAFQIYCDFYGYSIIAKGASLILGIRLMDNFDAPYLARSVKEFWQRWHISLSSWFRDYLYIPLGGNRKGKLRKNLNLFIVFVISGLWHGASVAFIFWGGVNGIYQIVADVRKSLLRKINLNLDMFENNFCVRVMQRCVTFALICFTWVFFRAGEMSDLVEILKNMFVFNPGILFDGTMYSLGVSKGFFGLLVIFILILLYVDYKKYHSINVINHVLSKTWWVQSLVYALMIFIIVMFGCYGVEYDTSQFIYFQF